MSTLTDLTLAAARDGLKAGEFSAKEITQAHIDAIEIGNEALNAYILLSPDVALKMAESADKKIADNDAGPLEGVPLGIKDLFCTKDVRTTACSHILDGFIPTYESTITQQLWDAGAVMLGRLRSKWRNLPIKR